MHGVCIHVDLATMLIGLGGRQLSVVVNALVLINVVNRHWAS